MGRVRTPVYKNPVKPKSYYGPRIVVGEYGGRYRGAPLAITHAGILVCAVGFITIISVIAAGADSQIDFPFQPLAIAWLVAITLMVVAYVKSFRHPLVLLETAPMMDVYSDWYALDESLRIKIPVTADSIVRTHDAGKLDNLHTAIRQLHDLDKKRKLAEARLDSTATDLIESALQAARDEREYLNEVQALEAK